MEFDDHDSLDDLLRDTSAEKFKKPLSSDEGVIAPLKPRLSAAKERKSALLAELFGPSISGDLNSSDVVDVLQPPAPPAQQMRLVENTKVPVKKSDDVQPIGGASVISKLGGNASSDRTEFSFGSYVPTASAQHRPQSGDFSRSGSGVDYIHPANEAKFDSYMPVAAARPASGEFSLAPSQLPAADLSTLSNTFHDSAFSFKAPEVSNAQVTTSDRKVAEILPAPAGLISNVPASNIPMHLSSDQLETVKDILDKFAGSFCERLVSAFSASDQLPAALASLQKCLENLVSDGAGMQKNVILESKLTKLECAIEALVSDNVNLSKQLRTCESQLAQMKSEVVKVKFENEHLIGNNMETVRSEVKVLSTSVEKV